MASPQSFKLEYKPDTLFWKWQKRQKGKMMTAHDHEIVSIYGFSKEQIDNLMTKTGECTLMYTGGRWAQTR